VCGLPSQVGFHLHHRQARGMGSSTGDPHAVENLLNLHPTCHLVWIERNREEAYRNGWLVKHPTDPADVPVLTYGGWRLLLASGLYAPVEPPAGTDAPPSR
jgi:hypothetical protein